MSAFGGKAEFAITSTVVGSTFLRDITRVPIAKPAITGEHVRATCL